MNSILRVLALDGVHWALAAIVLVFYATTALWLVFGVVGARLRRRIGATNLDGLPTPASPPRPEFTTENRKEKEEVAARAAKYQPPSAASRLPLPGPAPAGGPMRTISRIAGVLSLLLGLGFVGLLIYSLIARPSAKPLDFFSEDAWRALVATHWTVIVLTAIRVVVLIFGVREVFATRKLEG